MINSAFHLAAGLGLGTCLMAPRLIRAWRADEPLTPILRRLVGVAWVLGLFAAAPTFCLRLGLIPTPASAPGWNLFLFYPLLDRFVPHATLLGAAALTGMLMLHYGLILAALRRARRRRLRA